ncbi:MAG: hypothetical protein K1X94_16870 [Sandaracinaceae bacterium]|nr:hypothetical protein [Sandaracinaceae bacterium]
MARAHEHVGLSGSERMAKTMFTTQVRVIFCENCGGPLETAVQGGAIACTYCKATNAVRPRLDTFQPNAQGISEPERLGRLRMQDGQPMIPPPSLQALVAGNSVPDYKLNEAFDVFQATRREVKNTQSPEASERLYFLAVLVASNLALKGDFARIRALLETALDVVVLQRHQNCLRAMLARNAVREGDLLSAEQWLSGCDPRSDELRSDSDYRVARALIDTARSDYGAVLGILGRTNEEIPIADSLDQSATALRADALERLGDMNGAVTLLRGRMASSDAFGRQALEHFTRMYPGLHLCAGSLPAASAQHTQVAVKGAAARAGGNTGMILIVVGVISVVFTLFITAVTMLPMAALPAMFGNTPGGGMAGLAIGGTEIFVCFIVGVSTLLPLGIMGAVGYGLIKRSREAAWLRQNGISAMGQIREMNGTGTRINGVPLMKLVVSYASPQGPQNASTDMLMPLHLQMRLQPGATVPIRIHPQDPTKVVIEMD